MIKYQRYISKHKEVIGTDLINFLLLLITFLISFLIYLKGIEIESHSMYCPDETEIFVRL